MSERGTATSGSLVFFFVEDSFEGLEYTFFVFRVTPPPPFRLFLSSTARFLFTPLCAPWSNRKEDWGVDEE